MADWTRVQGTASLNTAVNTISFSSAVSNNNIVAGGGTIDSGKIITSVTDDKGNPYDVMLGDDDGQLASFGFKSNGLITNGPTTLTITYTPAGTPINFERAIDEFAPPTGTSAISYDGGTIVMGLGTSAMSGLTSSTPNFQNLNTDVLVYGVGVCVGAITAGAGFTAGASSNNGTVFVLSQWRIQSTAAVVNNLTFTSQGGTLWAVVFAIAPVSRSSWVPVQRAILWPSTNVTSFSLSLPNPILAGSILVGNIWCNNVDINQLSTLVDDKGANYKSNLQAPNPAGRGVFWSGGLISSGAQTISGTVSSAQQVGLEIAEFAPPPGTVSVALDGGGVVDLTTSLGGPTASTPNIITTVNGDLVYSVFEPEGIPFCNPLNGISILNGQGRSLASGYIIQKTAGNIAATWEGNSSAMGIIMFEMAISATIASGAFLRTLMGSGL